MERKNAGYKIISTFLFARSADGATYEIVLGENARGNFVTWECKDGINYYWGHYFETIDHARADFLGRCHANFNPER